MWRESSPEKKNIFKSLADQDRLKYKADCEEYLTRKMSNESLLQPFDKKTKFVTPAMKKQKFDFNFSPELIQSPEIPDFSKCGVTDPSWKVTDGFVVEDLGFDHLCHGEGDKSPDSKELALEHENVTGRVVKTPEELKLKGYDLVISKDLPKQLFDSPESAPETVKKAPLNDDDLLEMPVLERCHNISIDSNESTETTYDNIEMPVLEKQSD